jgi:leader peptidase (prepilin peptidase) / N-methyltransferase
MLDILAPYASHWGSYAFVIFLGTLWGSFGNVCIYRWPPSEKFPKGRSVVSPPSHCFVCGARVRWYDNTPLISYLWLRGKCRDCKTQFSARYLIVEALTGILFGAAWWAAMNHPLAANASYNLRVLYFVVYAAFAFFLVVVTFIDLDHMLILDIVTYPSVPVFYGLGLLLHKTWWHGLIGIAVGYGIIVAIRSLYWLIRRREGMGLGDAKLLAVIGSLWGWQGVLVALFGGSVLGSVVGIAAIVAMKMRGTSEVGGTGEDSASDDSTDADEQASDSGPAPDLNFALGNVAIPFGPFLTAAALFYMLAHPYFSIQLR